MKISDAKVFASSGVQSGLRYREGRELWSRKLYLSASRFALDEKRKNVWKLDYGLRPLQAFQAHLTQFLSKVFARRRPIS